MQITTDVHKLKHSEHNADTRRDIAPSLGHKTVLNIEYFIKGELDGFVQPQAFVKIWVI